MLLDPYNGKVHQTGQYFGPEERVCQASGMWSSQEPYCKKRGKTAGDYS